MCCIVAQSGTRVMTLVLGGGSPAERVSGLALGTDDYLSKLFYLPELVLRARALDRRRPRAVPVVLRAGGGARQIGSTALERNLGRNRGPMTSHAGVSVPAVPIQRPVRHGSLRRGLAQLLDSTQIAPTTRRTVTARAKAGCLLGGRVQGVEQAPTCRTAPAPRRTSLSPPVAVGAIPAASPRQWT